MATTAPPTAASSATTLDNSEASATTDLYRAAVGTVSTDYYQRIFTRFESADRAGISWNWAAALLTFNWMAFRQLWGAALTYVGALVASAILVFGIGRLVFQFSQELEWGLLAALGLLYVVLPGVFGNALLHAACRKRMARALSANTTVPEACTMLQREAPTRRRAAVLAILNVALFGGAVAAFLSLPDTSSLPLRTSKMEEARNQVLGKVTDLATRAAAPTAPAASAAASPASAPLATASAPSATRSAQGLVQAETKIPEKVASAPVASAPIAPASATANQPVRDASRMAAEIPKPAAAAKAEIPAVKPAIKPPEKPVTPVKPQDKNFYVNVGLFADENNARNAHTKLVDAGLAALKQDVRGPKGKFTRVRVGPLETLAEAETTAEKIRALGLEAIVLPP
jgi:cell division septation protein DedD